MTTKLSSEHLLRAVARRLEFRSGILVPEAVVSYVSGYHHGNEIWPGYEVCDQYLADLMWVTASDYATEFEVKISRADWRADGAKSKWGYMPPWITRFIYVVPVELGIPDFVPAFAGVWHFQASRRSYSELTVARAPRKIGQTKVSEDIKRRWLLNLHCRFWHQRLYTNNRVPEISQQEQPAEECAA